MLKKIALINIFSFVIFWGLYQSAISCEQTLGQLAKTIAEEHKIDPKLIYAIIQQESRWNVTINSPVGAIGLMQIMPATGKSFCKLSKQELYDPEKNIRCGVSYFKWLLGKFKDTKLALCGYNAGPGAVRKYGNKCPNYNETQKYAKFILAAFNSGNTPRSNECVGNKSKIPPFYPPPVPPVFTDWDVKSFFSVTSKSKPTEYESTKKFAPSLDIKKWWHVGSNKDNVGYSYDDINAFLTKKGGNWRIPSIGELHTIQHFQPYIQSFSTVKGVISFMPYWTNEKSNNRNYYSYCFGNKGSDCKKIGTAKTESFTANHGFAILLVKNVANLNNRIIEKNGIISFK
ncbi:MAG: lytic transglycosylase domain-containing protein [Thiomargarita sp.]|nr:lytic transglycosylase domain-containing protein [Thiomargarita sp.]